MKVYVSIGSNLGRRVENISKVVRLLKKKLKVTRLSSLYKTSPVGVEKQPDFVNGVIEIETKLSPKKLLTVLKSTEKNLGRNSKPYVKWGPRIIDLDILFYDKAILNTQRLVIPHPRIQERKFVLKPLNELNPGFVHPLLNKTISQLYREMKNNNQKIKRLNKSQ